MRKFTLIVSVLMFTSTILWAQARSRDTLPFGRQTVALAGVLGVSGKGFGLNYEYLLNKRQNLSCFLETAFCWSRAGQASLFYNGVYVQGHDRYPFMAVLKPGFRFYPKGSTGMKKYAIDLSFLYGFGKGDGGGFDHNTPILINWQYWGVLFGNTINIQIKKHVRITIGGSFGVGEDNGVAGAYLPFTDVSMFGQAFLSLGYRY